MTSIDKAAIFWSVAITAIGAGIAMGGLSLDESVRDSTATNVPTTERGTPQQQSAFMVGGVVQQNIDPGRFESDPTQDSSSDIPAAPTRFDLDGDGVEDEFDLCVDKEGISENQGCPEVQDEQKIE